MASSAQIGATYDYMDDIFRLSLGETADITAALYDGDFSLTLEEAQTKKHDYVLSGLCFKPGDRILDLGCGWGGMLTAVRERAGIPVGITLSARQRESCCRNGLEVYLRDWESLTPRDLGLFDGLVCIGAFEHFCSPERFLAGEQRRVYEDFFSVCHALLRPGGRLYLQTMTWGAHAPGYRAVSLDAPRGSDEYLVAVLARFYPGSWLPRDVDSIVDAAGSRFGLVSLKNGRQDYIETMKQWGVRLRRPSLGKAVSLLKLVPEIWRDPDMVYKIRSITGGFNRQCFVREIMDHQRMVFERLPTSSHARHR